MSTATNKAAAIQKIKQQQQAAAAGKNASNASSATAAPSSSSSATSSSAFRIPSVRGRARWSIDLDRPSSSSSLVPSGFTQADLLPPGYVSSFAQSSSSGGSAVEEKGRDESKHADLLYKSAMAQATAPGKQLLMTAFMLWMSGNSLQIFSIMMLGMAMWTPLSEMLSVGTRFARYAHGGVDLTVPKLTFIAMNLAGLALGLYKCNSMGLLPTSAADWIDTSVRPAVQIAGGGVL